MILDLILEQAEYLLEELKLLQLQETENNPLIICIGDKGFFNLV